jgi:hypothetical protein
LVGRTVFEHFPGPDQEVDAMMISGNRGCDQDGIVLFLVQRPVGDVGDGEVFDNFAALKVKVAFLETLVNRLVLKPSVFHRELSCPKFANCRRSRHLRGFECSEP